MASQTALSSAFSEFLMAIVRYYIWSVEAWSLIFNFMFCYAAALSIIVVIPAIGFHDLRMASKEATRRGSSVTGSSTAPENKSTRDASTEELRVVVSQTKKEEEVMDEFISKKGDGK